MGMSLPRLAVTLGDVAGVGPEITAKALLHHERLRELCVPIVVGDEQHLRRGVELAGGDPNAVRVIARPADAQNRPGTIELLQTGEPIGDVTLG